MGLVSTKCYCFVVVTFMAFLLVYGNRGPTMKDFEEAVNAAKNGTFVCHYDLSICDKRREVCSNITQTCHDVFGDITEEEIDRVCEEEMVKSSNFPGRRDVCIYRRGLEEVPQCPVCQVCPVCHECPVCEDVQVWTTPFCVVLALFLISVTGAIFILCYHKRILPGKVMTIVAFLLCENGEFQPVKQNEDNDGREMEGRDIRNEGEPVNPQAEIALVQARGQQGYGAGERE